MTGKIIIIGSVVLLITAISLLSLLTKSSKKSNPSNRRKKRSIINHTFYLKWYHRLYNNVLTRQGLLNIYKNISELSVYTDVEARIVSVKFYIRGNFVFAGVIVLFCILFKNLLLISVCILYAVILKDTVVNKRIDKIHYTLLLEERDMLSNLRQEYIRLRSVTDALANVECGKLIAKPIKEIYTILTSTNVQEKLEDFYASSPLKTLQTLAGICYAVDNSGDTTLSDGTSNLVSAISMITSEVNLEVERLKLQKSKFGKLEWLPVIPIFALSPIKSFFITNIPGTATIYNGMSGYLIVVGILFASVVCYKAITTITRPVAIKYDDRTNLDRKLMSNRDVRRFVTAIKPIKEDVIQKKANILKKAMSRLTIDYLYLRKFYFAVIAFVLVLFIIVASLILGRSFVRNNVELATMVSGTTMTDEEREMLQYLDNEFFMQPPMTDEELTKFVHENLPKYNESAVAEQVGRIRDKEKSLKRLTFKFWMLWIAMLSAYIAWNVPELIVKVRTWLIRSESEEDCLQLQTVIGIMMNTSIDTLDLLDWLSKHSRVFRPILIDAYHAYPSDDFRALRDLKYKAGLAEFKRIVDKLMLTVTQISIAEAFSDILLERDHLLRMREIAQQDTLEKKRAAMSPVSMLPLMLAIGLYFIFPVFVLGLKELTTLLTDTTLG